MFDDLGGDLRGSHERAEVLSGRDTGYIGVWAALRAMRSFERDKAALAG